jgi:glycosyltransferase involved in cell wall biosynthesis
MEPPVISIVLTTYNSEKIIRNVLDSILKQKFPLNIVELIIVDGGSKDRTPLIIKGFIREHKDKFLRVKFVIHDKNYGVSKARNDGVKLSRGQYMLILDHDVVMGEQVLKSLAEYLEVSPKNVGVAKPLLHTVKGRLLDIWRDRIFENKVMKDSTIADCALIRREVIEHVGYYDETLGPPHTICEEREYGARVEAKGYEVHSIGWVKVDHYQGIEENNANKEPLNQRAADKILKSLALTQLVVLRLLSDFRYRQALRKWVASMPSFKRLKWMLYSMIMPALVITFFIAITLETYIPLLLWGFIVSALYSDVLREYWNPRVLHITFLYSAVALTWRIARSTMLLIPTKVYSQGARAQGVLT